MTSGHVRKWASCAPGPRRETPAPTGSCGYTKRNGIFAPSSMHWCKRPSKACSKIEVVQMPIACRLKMQHGLQFCGSDCPASSACGVFRYFRIERPEDVPPPDEKAIDIAVLDMNHGWPNLGHDSLIHAILDCACDLQPVFETSGLHLRVLSYEVRRGLMVPERSEERRVGKECGSGCVECW